VDTPTPVNVFEAWCLIKHRNNINLNISFFFRKAVSIATKAGAGRPRYRVPCRQEQELSLFSTQSKPSEWPILPITIYEPKDLSKRGMGWKISREVNLITHVHLVQWLRMRGVTSPRTGSTLASLCYSHLHLLNIQSSMWLHS